MKLVTKSVFLPLLAELCHMSTLSVLAGAVRFTTCGREAQNNEHWHSMQLMYLDVAVLACVGCVRLLPCAP
jgi:uncharacterized membrane protein